MSMHRWLPALVLFAACTHRPPPPATPSDPLGRAVHFTLPSNGEGPMAIPVAGAPKTVLAFFSPGCEPCAKSIPALYEKRAALAQRGAKLVLVAKLGDEQSASDAQRALESWGVKESFLVDAQGRASRSAGVDEVPLVLVLDAQGTTKWTFGADASPDNIVLAVD